MANNRTLTITVAGDDRSWLRTVKSVDEGAKKIRGSIGDADKSTAAFAGSMRKLFDTTAKIGSLGLAAQGISALGAAAGATAAGLAPLTGALAAYPALALAAGQGLGVFKLATANIADAVGGLNEQLNKNSKAFKELDPQAKKIALRLEELKKPIRELSGVAQKGLFPGLEQGIKDASRNLDVLRPIVSDTAKVLGELAERAGVVAGSDLMGKDIARIGANNVQVIRRMGNAGITLAVAMRDIISEAQPLVSWISKMSEGLAQQAQNTIFAARKSGELRDFLHETQTVMSRLGRISGDLGRVLVVTFSAAYPLGNRLMRDLTKSAEAFADWAESAGGRNAIAQFFKDAEPAIREVARLAKDITVAFFELGRGDQVAPLLRTVRTQLLPAIQAMVAGTTKEFMPAFLAFATESIKLFTHLGGTSGPLVQFTILMGRIVGGVNKLLDAFPLLNTAIVGLVAAGGISKALRIGAAVSGMTTLIGMLKTAAGIGAAGGAAKGGIAGKVKDVVSGAGKVRGATPANPLFVAVVAGGGGGVPIGPTTGGGKVGTAGKVARIGAGATVVGAVALGGAALLQSQIPQLDRLTDALDRLSGPSRGPNKRAAEIGKLAKAMQQARRDGDPQKIGAVSAAIDKLAGNQNDDTSKELRRIAAEGRRLAGSSAWPDVRKELRDTRNAFSRMSADGSVSMKEIRQTVASNTKRIKDRLGNDTAAGKRALAQNFREARKAVRETMRDSTVSTRTGLKQIRDLMARELQATYGISLKTARHQSAKNTVAGATGGDSPAGASTDYARGGRMKLAGGGWIGGRGMVSDDVVPIGPGALAAYGEYFATGAGGKAAVINRHQAPAVDMSLALGGYPSLDQGADLGTIEQAMGGAGGLNQLFSSVTRPHMFAKGGIVPVPGFPGESANRSVVGKIVAIAKRFGLTLTDAYGQGHKSPGHTQTGTAADFSGPDKSMDAAVKMLTGQGYLVGYDGRFGSQNWPGHGPSTKTSNFHLHVELGGKGGKITGAASHRPIVAPKVRGGGAMGGLAQQGLKMATSAANRMMTKAGEASMATPVSGGGGGAAAPPGRIRQWLAAGLRLAGQAASSANINTLYGRVMQESGGNPRAVNNWDSNAKAGIPSKGLLQTIGPTFQAYKVKGHNDIFNPVDNVAAAVRYMLARYGRLVAASGSGYARGGRVRGFQSGGTDNFYSGFHAAKNKGDVVTGDSFYAGFHSAKDQYEATKFKAYTKAKAGTTGAETTGYAMDVARSQRGQATARAKDNLASLIKAMVAEIRAKRKRLKRVRKVLKGRINKARRQRLVEEETQLIGEITDLAAAIKEYRADAAGGATTVSAAEELDAGVDTEAVEAAKAAEEERIANLPTAADYIQAKIDEASLTESTADDQAALTELVALRQTELTAARATGDPRKISEAIQAWKAASEALKGLDDSAARLGETMKALQEEIKRQNDIYNSVIGVSSREAVRAMADMISGQIVGVGLQGRRQTAGTGTVALMP